MRILYASERPPYPFFLGGAARAAHTLLVRLATRPHMACEAVGSRDYSVSPWRFPETPDHATLGIRAADQAHDELDCGYSIRLLTDFYATLAGEIERTRPDLVWSQLEGALPVLQTAHRLGVTGLCYVHDAEFDAAQMRAIAALDCHLIASSGFLADKVFRATGRRAGVVYPPAELHFDTPGNPDGVVTMINPHPVKGLETLVEIARRLPAVNFLLQESWKLGEAAFDTLSRRLADLPNVRLQRRVTDMRSVYGQTKLLLVPSLWEEGFGMVALEAQSCGIPVIASARGGLPESVGDGGLLIQDYRNAEAWVGTIRQVLGDEVLYQRLAEQAVRHARSEEFSAAESARRFVEICSAKPTRPGFLARGWRGLGRYLSGARGW